MSFNNHAQKVRNSHSSLSTRRSSFNSCIASFCWLTKQSYRKVRTSYSVRFDFDNLSEQNPTPLLAALDSLIAERNRFLEKLHTFERKRIREKMLGRRHPSKTDIEKLFKAIE